MPEGREGGGIQTETNLTQIYKNMPLDSYQQLRTVGALFTEKGNMYQYLQQSRLSSHMGMRRLQNGGFV